MLEKDKAKNKENPENPLEQGKISLFDIDRDEDLMWAVADLYCAEKHLQLTLSFITKKLEEEPQNEYYKKLSSIITSLLNAVRIQRTKNLERLEKFKEKGIHCLYKHLLGAMMQFAEVGSKDIFMNEDEEKIKLDFETSIFCRDAILALNQVQKIKEKMEVKDEKVERTT
jgi:hypothetical protein